MKPDLKKTQRQKNSTFQHTLDRLPPHSTEAEQGVLGCILLSPNDCMGECVEKLNGREAFYELRHQTIYEALTAMFAAQEPIDTFTLLQKLKDKGVLEQIGGVLYLSKLANDVPSAANLSYYLDIIQEKFLLRKMIAAWTEAISKIYDHTGEATELLDILERDVLAVRPMQTASSSIKELVGEALTKIEKIMTSDNISGLSTGLHDLDKLTDGLHEGEMVVIAAFPGSGKSALTANIIIHNVLSGISSAFFTAEMLPVQIVLRSLCAEARVNARDKLQSDVPKFMSPAARLSKSPLFLENVSGNSIGQVVAKARRLKQKNGIKLLAIDYIQLLTSPGADSREQEISAISKGIKKIAMELNIPVIALSQLSDEGNLRESRAIGQDADGVWYIEPEKELIGDTISVQIKVKKNREGATGNVPAVFLRNYTKFVDAARVHPDDVPATKNPYND